MEKKESNDMSSILSPTRYIELLFRVVYATKEEAKSQDLSQST
jgi:hypothetical protein